MELGNLQAVETLQLKDPTTGHFSRDTVKCITELIGEHEVSASRCSDVIACVSKHLLKKEIPADQLPSLRTVLRYADKGHVLSKIQVSESLLNADHYDLHTDGTTKCGKKVIGQQMTTSTGQSVVCGYSLVATEDTGTLLDVTTNLLHELTDVSDQTGSAADDMFKKLLGKLSATMSDRAAVNKSFNNQLNALKKATLGTPENNEFLHCNVHFLLGLARSLEKSMKAVATDPTGRDKHPKFSSSKKEVVVCRLI